jgi:HAD superfamily hydrolase (TIGR01549 family)
MSLAKQTCNPRAVIEMAMTQGISIEELGKQFGVDSDEVRRLTADLRGELDSIGLFVDADAALRALSALGVEIGLVSNLAEQYAQFALDQLPVRPSVCVWSFECGWLKPDPRIFARACELLDVKPENALMVGDSMAADFRGARSFGMQAVLLDRQSLGQGGCITVQSLDSIPSIVDKSRQ